jgi:hypothetical protein
VRDQNHECAVEYLRGIPIRNNVTQQILRAPELVVCFATDRELDLETLRRERDDRRPRAWFRDEC